MRAGKLVIWAEDIEDTETREGAEGLYEKSLGKCGRVELWAGKAPKLIKAEKGTGKEEELKDGIGVYSIFHSIASNFGPDLGMMSGQDYCDKVLAQVLPDETAQITRIVFLACYLAPNPDEIKSFAGQDATAAAEENTKQQSFVVGVVLALNAQGIKPNIVGWDDFVSILPAKPSNNRNVYDSENKAALSSDQMKGPLAGKKYVQFPHKKSSRYGLVTPAFRADHKRTFSISKGGKLQITGPGGWSEH